MSARAVSPPGKFIARELEARGWSQQTLADVMGTSPTLVSEVINAKRAVTPDTAALLGRAFDTSAELWLNLDARYQASIAKPAKAGAATARARLYTKVPVRAMIRRGWIKETRDLARLEADALAFLEQRSLDEEFFFAHAARKSGTYDVTKPEQFAWLSRARQLARLVAVEGRWRANRVDDLVSDLRRLILSPPALRDLPRVLSTHGIRLVVVERLPGLRMDGASFWLDQEPVIALSLSHDRIDNAWHTIFHEVDHVAHGETAVDEQVLTPGEKPPAEQRADNFAVQTLVPQDGLDDFCNRVAPLFSQVRIVGFANLLRVHPGIVVGQLHHRKEVENRAGLPWTHFRKLLVPVRKFATDTAMTEGWGRTVPVIMGQE